MSNITTRFEPDNRQEISDPIVHQAYIGTNGLWGVCQGNGVEYEAEFCRLTAETIADMYNSDNPPADWYETSDRLTVAGLPF